VIDLTFPRPGPITRIHRPDGSLRLRPESDRPARLTCPASPRRTGREQEDEEAQATRPPEQGQPRQASARRPPL